MISCTFQVCVIATATPLDVDFTVPWISRRDGTGYPVPGNSNNCGLMIIVMYTCSYLRGAAGGPPIFSCSFSISLLACEKLFCKGEIPSGRAQLSDHTVARTAMLI